MPKTLFDKIWEAHEVAPGLIYIDLHLVHEVTSPQAFDGLRLNGRKVRRPDRTLATADHNTPTDGTPVASLIKDQLSRVQVETLERNCAEFGVPVYSLGSDRQGIVHVIGPELGVTQPNMTIEGGGRAGMVAPDETTFAWLAERGIEIDPEWSELRTDGDAAFDREIAVDASSLSPQVTWGTT